MSSLISRRKKEEAEAQAIREEIFKIAAESPNPPKWLSQDKTPGKPGIPLTIWSDFHYGEVVKKDEVAGQNFFNPTVAAKRIQTLTEGLINICYNHMGKSKVDYPGLVLMLGGDMISGSIHEELLINDDRTIVEQLLELEEYLIAAIKTLKNRFGRLFIPCVVGNHGRSTIKPRFKGRVHSSFDWSLYCHLARYFRDDEKIQFFIPNESDAYFEVYGHRYLLTHGDSLGVKGGDGIIGSIGPIMRGAIKVGRSEAQIGREVDTIVMGHWHTYLTLPGVIVNNSLKGYCEYARLALRAPYSRPSQALWFQHQEQGVTAHWQVYLEPLKKNERSNKIVSWSE